MLGTLFFLIIVIIIIGFVYVIYHSNTLQNTSIHEAQEPAQETPEVPEAPLLNEQSLMTKNATTTADKGLEDFEFGDPIDRTSPKVDTPEVVDNTVQTKRTPHILDSPNPTTGKTNEMQESKYRDSALTEINLSEKNKESDNLIDSISLTEEIKSEAKDEAEKAEDTEDKKDDDKKSEAEEDDKKSEAKEEKPKKSKKSNLKKKSKSKPSKADKLAEEAGNLLREKTHEIFSGLINQNLVRNE